MPEPRFLTPADVAEILNVSAAQIFQLLRSRDLPAIQVGGKNQWRIERDQLEAYIQRKYEENARPPKEPQPQDESDESES